MLTVRWSGQRQRSSPSSRACRRRHDIQRGIHVRVARVSASDTLEFGLRLPVRRIDRAAAPAGLAGVHRRNNLHVCRLVLEHPSQLRPPGIQNFPVESCFPPDVSARMLCRAPSGPGHGLRFQILDGEQSGGVGESSAGLVAPAMAYRGDPPLRAGEAVAGQIAAVGAFPAPRHHTLVPALARLQPRLETGEPATRERALPCLHLVLEYLPNGRVRQQLQPLRPAPQRGESNAHGLITHRRRGWLFHD